MRGYLTTLLFVPATLAVGWSALDAQTAGRERPVDPELRKKLELKLPKGLPQGLPQPKKKGWPQPRHPDLESLGLPQADPDLLPQANRQTLLERMLDRLQRMQRTFEPDVVVNSLDALIREQDNECPLFTESCRERDELKAVRALIAAGSAGARDCNAAAKAFDPFLDKLNPPETVARQFDMACLGSIEPRLVDGRPETPLPRPAVLDAGGAVAGRQGALTAIGLIEVAGVPFCGALLRNDRTLVTARHCHTMALQQFAEGKATVRPLSGGRGPWKVVGTPIDTPSGPAESVQADWIRLRIDTTDAIGAADVRMVADVPRRSVTLVGHFAPFHHASGPPPAGEGWRRGLRFPRAGLCVVVTASARCVQLACQTVKGFSGTPLFQVDPARPDQPLHVVGLISRPQQQSAGCGLDGRQYTLAVPAAAIR